MPKLNIIIVIITIYELTTQKINIVSDSQGELRK